MIRIERVDWENVDWKTLDGFSDRTVFQTRAWLDFLRDVQGGEVVVAVVRDNEKVIGYLTGMIVRKFGIRIFGSPFAGWTTGHMGFNLSADCDYGQLLTAARVFVFTVLKCHYLEIFDRHIGEKECAGLPFRIEYDRSFTIDLTQGKEEILAAMNTTCRKYCKRAGRKVVIEEAGDAGFADDFYDQLKDVFLRQGKVPTYDRERVRALIRHLRPAGALLMLRARTLEGECVATGIFVCFNDVAYAWGLASLQSKQGLRPNEPLLWHALQYYKDKGVALFDFGGGGEYKKKFGGIEVDRHYLTSARYPLLQFLHDTAKRLWRFRRRCLGVFTKTIKIT